MSLVLYARKVPRAFGELAMTTLGLNIVGIVLIVGETALIIAEKTNLVSILTPIGRKVYYFLSSGSTFSLEPFWHLLQRELAGPIKQFKGENMRSAFIGLCALQRVTKGWQEDQWFKHLREIDVNKPLTTNCLPSHTGSQILATSDVIISGQQIVVGEGPEPTIPSECVAYPTLLAEHKINLLRLSKMARAIYGGSLLFFSQYFGFDVDMSATKASNGSGAQGTTVAVDLLGKYDQQIFERSMILSDDPSSAGLKVLAFRDEPLMPRFAIVMDPQQCQIIVVIRGTIFPNDVMVDLDCELDSFQPASTLPAAEMGDDDRPISGMFERETKGDNDPPQYKVHGGMLRMARAMGNNGNPVHQEVSKALADNPKYGLILCGHSLGAGIAGILGMMWADPKKCLTVRSSGLPPDRRVQVYCFAPPALTDANLGRFADKLIVSVVYSHDAVPRLSLGSVRNKINAVVWLCEAEGKGEGWSTVINRSQRWLSSDNQEDMNWLITTQKILEANMQDTDRLFPPGKVFWAIRDGSLHPCHQRYHATAPSASGSGQSPRLFEVLNVEKVFSQIDLTEMETLIPVRNHFPYEYERVLADLL